MGRKSRMLSIGEVSRFTGASIKSLRYYEKIKILEPAFVDPCSGYRYYSFDQVYLIYIIMFCIEMDIPLKDLTGYIDKNGTIDYSALLAYGKVIAEKKLHTLKRGLRFIEDADQAIALTEKHHNGRQIYTREIPEKRFCLMPYGQSFEDADVYEVSKLMLELDYGGDDFYEILEYGYMCEHSPRGIQRYAFMELPGHKAQANARHIPGGTYFCRQSEESAIEQAPRIFSGQLGGASSFLVIETEVFAGKYKVNKPVNELRFIALSETA